MSREEVRREHKEREGDPLHKAERQRLHREMLARQMIDDVRRANLVVVDRDRVAVALRYDSDGPVAPLVAANAPDFTAECAEITEADRRKRGVRIWCGVVDVLSLVGGFVRSLVKVGTEERHGQAARCFGRQRPISFAIVSHLGGATCDSS
jgi:hypothetical protein